MEKQKCLKCGSEAVMSIGICLSCGFRNKPLVDPEQEKRLCSQQQEEERLAIRENLLIETTTALEDVLTMAKAGDLTGATKKLRDIVPPTSELNVEKQKTQAELWRLKGVPDMQLKTLETLADQLPFTEDNLDLYYQLACHYHDGGSDAKALTVLNRFVENEFDWFKDDILERWKGLKDKGVEPSFASSSQTACHILVGAMDRTVESVRAWIDQATANQRCFSESILLNSDTFQEPERIEQGFSGELDLDKIIAEHDSLLQNNGYGDYHTGQQHIAIDRGGPASATNIPVLKVGPRRPGPLLFDYGCINLAAQLMPEGRSAVSLAFYEFFTPRDPRDFPGQQPDLRDFNDKVYQTVIQIQQPSTERTVLMRSHRDLIMKTVKAVLSNSLRAGSDLLF